MLCTRRVDDGTRAWFNFWKGDISCDDARADLLPDALFGRDDSVQIEYRHQRVRRFVMRRNIQSKAVDAPGLNVVWISDQVEAQMRTWWDPADMSKRAATDQPTADSENERKRKHSAWDVYRGEDGGDGNHIKKTSIQ